MGVVYMEAMAMEVATIGTNAGGVPEIITDGVDGLLVPPMDPPALARAIRCLIDEPAFRESLGKAGRRKILKQFDSRLWATTLYRRLFGHGPEEHLVGPEPAALQNDKGARRVGAARSTITLIKD